MTTNIDTVSAELRIAAAIPCDVRTVRKWLAGTGPRNRFLAARITDEARRLGVERHVPGDQRAA